MCLAVPAQIVKINDDLMAICELSGIQKEISIALIPEVQIGDFVIIHVGYALSKIDEDEARKTLEMFS